MSTENIIIMHLTEAGDGTGNHHFTGDYSAVSAKPLIAPPADEDWVINSILWYR